MQYRKYVVGSIVLFWMQPLYWIFYPIMQCSEYDLLSVINEPELQIAIELNMALSGMY